MFPSKFSVKQKSSRKVIYPRRFDLFWDMEIPTQFYEDDFIEFENYLQMKGDVAPQCNEDPFAASKYVLKEYEKFEKFWHAENKKIWRQKKRRQEKLS